MDLFGKQCTVGTHKDKTARRDLDKNAINFLVQLRLELELISEDEKRALAETQTKCLAE
jgi:hypothetical protein